MSPHGEKKPFADRVPDHPFTLGQLVYPKAGNRSLASPLAHPVHLRGKSEKGFWVSFADLPFEFPADDFTSVPPMAPAIDATDEEAV